METEFETFKKIFKQNKMMKILNEGIKQTNEDFFDKIKIAGYNFFDSLKTGKDLFINTIQNNINFISNSTNNSNINIKKEKNNLNNNNKNNNNNNEEENVYNINEIYNNSVDDLIEEKWGICPITDCYMEHPVRTPEGQYYEKEAIENWLEKHDTDPLTRNHLTKEMLIEDFQYKKAIQEFKKENNL